METDATRLGQYVKDVREDKGITIKEVENITSIRANHIEAIEAGRPDQFLSSVYMAGFIRQYAQFLGVDIQMLKEQFPSIFEASGPKQEFAYGIGTLEHRSGEARNKKVHNLIWTGVLVVSLFVAWKLAKYLQII
ncbi:MAG: hypothetical protein S4CHLAM102_01230 [Chlamydiia bacterium]|nr:hypothetical protein [Chlamydiia bacterium]